MRDVHRSGASSRQRLYLGTALIAGFLWWLPAAAQSTNGTCGTVASTCAVGTVTGSTDNGVSTSWTCLGGGGGANAWCSVADGAGTPVNGSCGTAAASCLAGTATGTSDNGQMTYWTCAGSNGGTNAWCTASDAVVKTVNGACGPGASSCAAGTVTGSVDNGSSTSWTCAGSGGGSNAWCSISDSVVIAVNGVCGTAASTCSAGTVTGSSDDGTSTSWDCVGGGGGTSAWCMISDAATPLVNGSCGTVASTCVAGTVANSSNNGASTSWTCDGGGGGSNAWCNVPDTVVPNVNGTCGATASTCSAGTVSGSTTNGASTSWSCLGSGSGTNAYCSIANPVAVNGVCGAAADSCAAGTATGISNNGYANLWTCSGLNNGASAACSVPVTTSAAATKLGVNLSWVLDWSDREMMFVDVMKDARGFATPATYWDPTSAPVPLDANGWPTTDAGVVFLSTPGDPLGRPVTSTFPSLIGTYSLSFTGKAKVSGAGCCVVKNLAYNSQNNTSTASVVVGPSDGLLALSFTGTSGGVKNVKLLRPGYASGTTQVFTSQFLKAIAPFGTLRFMDPLETNGNPVTSWAQRTLPTNPEQSAPSGLAWEYVVQLANTSGKDIWVNIPEGVDLTDPTSNNYAVKLAQLLKSTLNPAIHVYLEYSNEVWNAAFPQTQANLSAATNEVNSGADPTLNYDNVNSSYYWASRRVVHQTVRLSQLFQSVYGAAAMNTTIRPVFMSQYAQPYLAEDGLRYLKANFGAPGQFLYGIGGAPYFGGAASSYPDVPSTIAGMTAGLSAVKSGFPTEPYSGNVAYSNLSYKGFADYYGLRSLSYEGGPAMSSGSSAAVNEAAVGSSALTPLIENYFADWFGCGNDLFVYFDLAEPQGNFWGAYEDLSIATPKSLALAAVAATPLSTFTSCTAR